MDSRVLLRHYTYITTICKHLYACSECELALDVYEQLLSEGCTPNMVTWNILIDIHSKSGNCEQAVAVLDEIRGQVGRATLTGLL